MIAIHDANIASLLARQQVLNERPATATVGEELERIARSLTTTPARTLADVALKLQELVDVLSSDDDAGWALAMARSCLHDMNVLQ